MGTLRRVFSALLQVLGLIAMVRPAIAVVSDPADASTVVQSLELNQSPARLGEGVIDAGSSQLSESFGTDHPRHTLPVMEVSNASGIAFPPQGSLETGGIPGASNQAVRSLAATDDQVVTMGSFSVTAGIAEGTAIALLNARRKSAVLSDSISSDRFSELAVGNAAEAMTKVSGASLVDGKYVVIRGLGDRYLNTLLNGVTVPTADPDKRAVQMDQFPSELIESITTAKSFTPDQPGAFSGGSVNLRTKAFPESFFLSVGLSADVSSNLNPWQTGVLTVPGHSTDALAVGARDRAAPKLPETLPDRTRARLLAQQGKFELAEQLDAATRLFDNRSYYPGTADAGPNSSVNLAMGGQHPWGEEGGIFGYMATLSYDREFAYYDDAEQNRYSGVAGDIQPKLLLTSDRSQLSFGKAPRLPSFAPPLGVTSSSEDVSWAAFAKLAFRPSSNHEVTLDLLHTQTAEDRVLRGVGEQAFDYQGAVNEVYSILYTERSVSSALLAGRSVFPSLAGLQLEWRVSQSRTNHEQPDYRTLSAFYLPDSGRFINATGVQPNRFFRSIDEESLESGMDFSLPFDFRSREALLKFGAVVSNGDRVYEEQRFQWSLVPQTHEELEAFPGDVGIVARTGSSVTFGNTISRLQEPNNYEGRQRMGGTYAMVDAPITERLRAIAGVRFEGTRMDARPVRVAGIDPRDASIRQTDPLPALSLVYAVNPKINWRLAYGRTIARPTFKELTDIRYEDVFTLDTYIGNPELRVATIDNVDVRWEAFPKRGDTIAVGAFYKRMRDPIEVVFRPQAGSIQPQNVDRGDVYGVEFEFRRRLDFLSPSLRAFSFGANLALVRSSVTIPESEMDSIRLQEPLADNKRELHSQSPYVVNAELTWQAPQSGTVATVSFNVVGRRLSLVQFGSIPDVYEQPAPTLNFVFSQRLGRGLKLKFSATNLLNPDRRKTMEGAGESLTYERYRVGGRFSLSLAYSYE